MISGVTLAFELDMKKHALYKAMTRYNILRKGKVVYWNVSETELMDRLEDYAVEQYVTGENIAEQITYEPIKEED